MSKLLFEQYEVREGRFVFVLRSDLHARAVYEGEALNMPFTVFMQPARDWCKERFGSAGWIDHGLSISFDDPRRATEFKLRWC